MTDTNSYNIAGWMLNRLRLRENELLAYAIVFGFSQDGNSAFHNDPDIAASWMGVSVRRVMDIFIRLQEKGLIYLSNEGWRVNRQYVPVDVRSDATSDATSAHLYEKNIKRNIKEKIKENLPNTTNYDCKRIKTSAFRSAASQAQRRDILSHLV